LIIISKIVLGLTGLGGITAFGMRTGDRLYAVDGTASGKGGARDRLYAVDGTASGKGGARDRLYAVDETASGKGDDDGDDRAVRDRLFV
jgi:hypothetical protein